MYTIDVHSREHKERSSNCPREIRGQRFSPIWNAQRQTSQKASQTRFIASQETTQDIENNRRYCLKNRDRNNITALQDCITDIRSCMITDRPKLNDDKTEYMIISTRAQLDSEIMIGQAKLLAVRTVRVSVHVNNACQAISYHLYNV